MTTPQSLRKRFWRSAWKEQLKNGASRRRYELHLPVHYRISQKGVVARWGTGMTREMSTTGLSFRTRKPLPVGSHVEMIVDWPAKYADDQPIDLQLTGFIVRSDVTSHRRPCDVAALPHQFSLRTYRATA